MFPRTELLFAALGPPSLEKDAPKVSYRVRFWRWWAIIAQTGLPLALTSTPS